LWWALFSVIIRSGILFPGHRAHSIHFKEDYPILIVVNSDASTFGHYFLDDVAYSGSSIWLKKKYLGRIL